MLTNEHETLVGMFRHRPELAADALARTLGVDVPKFDQAQLSAGDLPDLRPTEYRADAVVTLGDRNGGRPVFAVVVEIQLRRDKRKRYSWPVYVATLHARLECPAILLVVCKDRAVATWCAKPIVVTEPGLSLTPLVLGPNQIPVVDDPAVGRIDPEAAVLSAMAHGSRKGPERDFPGTVGRTRRNRRSRSRSRRFV